MTGGGGPQHGITQCPGPECSLRAPACPHLWEVALRRHPDRLFVEHVIQGLEQGFHIGFDGTHLLRSASCNMASAYAASQMVYDYLQAEVTLGRILGPLSPPPDGLVVSKFGVIPKKHEVGKWRLILDLSSPEGASGPLHGRAQTSQQRVDPYSFGCNPVGTPLGAQGSSVQL